MLLLSWLKPLYVSPRKSLGALIGFSVMSLLISTVMEVSRMHGRGSINSSSSGMVSMLDSNYVPPSPIDSGTPQVDTTRIETLLKGLPFQPLVETTQAERTDPLLTNVAGLHSRIRFPTNMGVERENRWSGASLEEPILLPNDNDKPLQVDTSHYVMSKTGWDASPVVIEKYKLLFFTVPKVGCTVFKHLFRRMEGIEDWDAVDSRLPHDIEVNGLTLLSHYSVEQATEWLTSPEWTRAIFVREPKKRALSAFLEKGVAIDDGLPFIGRHCCPDRKACIDAVSYSFSSFLWLISKCRDDHWNAQSWRMEGRYWSTINFVGHLETAAVDTKNLLQRIGAWEEYGATGWGKQKDGPIFDSVAVPHQTGASSRLQQYYTAEIDALVEKLYEQDYQNPYFNFTTTATTAQPIEYWDNATDRRVHSIRGIEQTHEGEFPIVSNNNNNNKMRRRRVRIDETDYVYRRGLLDGSPIVVEKFKLIFFTTPGCASLEFKRLLRRLSGMESDFNSPDDIALQHNPVTNGLKYLYDFPKREAESILQSKEWTKAMFVRDPKQRLLSAFLSRSPQLMGEYLLNYCCPDQRKCASDRVSLDEFVEVTSRCHDPLWLAQSYRMESQYWSSVNFVGHTETAQQDTKNLLDKIGASWEQYGATGWGENGQESLFQSGHDISPQLTSVFFTPETERRIEEVYSVDYNHAVLGLQKP